MGSDQLQQGLCRSPGVLGPPVAGQGEVEWLAQPVDEDRLRRGIDHFVVDGEILLGSSRGRGEVTRGNQDRLATEPFDELGLLPIGGDDLLQ